MSVKYRPRNDKVLLRVIDRGQTESGLQLPQQSQEGQEVIVLAVGPKVEDLKKGDRVIIISEEGGGPTHLRGEKDLYVVKESEVALVKVPAS